MKKLNYILPILFIVVLFGGFVLHYTTVDRDVSEMENRNLQTADFEPNTERLVSGELFKDMESYISDQFPFRDWWMKLYVEVQIAMGKTFIEDYAADPKSGWIVAKAAELEPEKTLTTFVDDFVKIQDNLKKHDIPMAFFTFPAKATYVREPSPDFMPEDKGIENNSRLHEILTEKGIDNAKIMDSIPDDVDPKDMYFKTDHHWNMYGAYQGYLALMKNINERMGQNIQPIPYDENNMKCLPNEFAGSWNKVLYMTVENDDQICYNYPKSFETQFDIYKGEAAEGKKPIPFHELYGQAQTFEQDDQVTYASGYSFDYPMITIVNKDYDSDKHIVVVKDSYFNAMQLHVASHFRKTTILDLRHLKGDPADVIAGLNPDYVFFVYNDRNFNVVEEY